MSKTCYVTAFLDIGRNDWIKFGRSFNEYLTAFLPYICLFENEDVNDSTHDEMIVYIDEKHYDVLREKIPENLPIRLVKINREFMKEISPLWNRLDREREIMKSLNFQNLIKHRITYPETHNPEYTLINHAKVDFVEHAIGLSNAEYFCWSDFGYFALENRIPKRLIDINKLNLEKVNYTLINPITDKDNDVMYTLYHAPERIGGFWFFGNRAVMKEYTHLYRSVHQNFQNYGLVDDDQHLALRCYLIKPEMFTLHNLGDWHRAFVAFQKDLLLNYKSCQQLGDWKIYVHNHPYQDVFIFRTINNNTLSIIKTDNKAWGLDLQVTLIHDVSGEKKDFAIGKNITGKKDILLCDNFFSQSLPKNVFFSEKFTADNLDRTSDIIICVPSVIHVSNNTLNNNKRSVFTNKERYDQTIEQLKSIKEKIPTSTVILQEASALSTLEIIELANLCDYIILYNDPITHFYCHESPVNKGLGEMRVISHIIKMLEGKSFTHFFKFGGRYKFSESFDLEKFLKKVPVVLMENLPEGIITETIFYCLPVKYLENYCKYLEKRLTPHTYESIEIIFSQYLLSLKDDKLIVKNLGVEGYRAIDGFYNKI